MLFKSIIKTEMDCPQMSEVLATKKDVPNIYLSNAE